MHTQEEYQALRDLIIAHIPNAEVFPAATMKSMEKQLNELLDDIDPRCEDY